MDWQNFLFSFEGRSNRAKYWLFALLGTIFSLVLVAIVFGGGFSMAAWVVAAVLYLGLLYSAVAVGVKRLHDRDKSGWWLLIFYFGPGILDGVGRLTDASAISVAHMVLSVASLAVAVWGIVELGILRGTRGPNQYGPDPLERRA